MFPMVQLYPYLLSVPHSSSRTCIFHKESAAQTSLLSPAFSFSSSSRHLVEILGNLCAYPNIVPCPTKAHISMTPPGLLRCNELTSLIPGNHRLETFHLHIAGRSVLHSHLLLQKSWYCHERFVQHVNLPDSPPQHGLNERILTKNSRSLSL